MGTTLEKRYLLVCCDERRRELVDIAVAAVELIEETAATHPEGLESEACIKLLGLLERAGYEVDLTTLADDVADRICDRTTLHWRGWMHNHTTCETCQTYEVIE